MWKSKKQSNILPIYSCDCHLNWWQSLVLLLTNFCGFWMHKSADCDAMAGGRKEIDKSRTQFFFLDYKVSLYHWEGTAYYSIKFPYILKIYLFLNYQMLKVEHFSQLSPSNQAMVHVGGRLFNLSLVGTNLHDT